MNAMSEEAKREVLEKFIKIYREEPCLWKRNHPHCKNKKYKRVAYLRLQWELEALHPNVTEEFVRKKINGLRRTFKRELKKVNDSREISRLTGQPVYEPSLWYYDSLRFLDDKESEMESGENACSEGDESDANSEEDIPSQLPDINMHTQQQPKDGYRAPVVADIRPLQESSGCKRKRDNMTYNPDNEWLTNVESTGSSYMPPPNTDGDEAFGQYVVSKLKEMDKDMKILSEELIFKTILKGTKGELNENTKIRDVEPRIIKSERSGWGNSYYTH